MVVEYCEDEGGWEGDDAKLLVLLLTTRKEIALKVIKTVNKARQ